MKPSSFTETAFMQTTDGPYRAQQDHDGKTGRDGPNEDIAQAIEELAKLYRDALHKNKFQRESYQKVANIVRSEFYTGVSQRGFGDEADQTFAGVDVPYRIESGKQAQEVKGIGAQMAERVSLPSLRARHAVRISLTLCH